jgi:hypothetical protein
MMPVLASSRLHLGLDGGRQKLNKDLTIIEPSQLWFGFAYDDQCQGGFAPASEDGGGNLFWKVGDTVGDAHHDGFHSDSLVLL